MILYLDIRRDRQTLAVIGARKEEWLSGTARGGIYRLLDRAHARFGVFTRHPKTVVVATGERDGDVTWSAMRTAAAVGNTLAFAWGASVIGVEIPAKASRTEIVALVRKAATKAKRSRWLKATYNGEPNITKAKPLF